MTAIVFPLVLLLAAAVVFDAAWRAARAWRKLRDALGLMPERQACRITHVAVLVRPAPAVLRLRPVSRLAPLRFPQPALRAAA